MIINKSIFVTGAGRTGLIMKSFGIRLLQLGFDAGILGWLHRVSQIQLIVITHHISHYLGWFTWGGLE